MKKTLKLLFISCCAALAVSSCAKPGCTDANATNYSSDYNEYDGSCIYRGDIVFWTLPEVKDELIALGHDTLRFELEGEVVDCVRTEFFFAPAGECNTPGTVTIPREELTYEERWYKYRVYGKFWEELYSDFVLLKANECLDIRLLNL